MCATVEFRSCETPSNRDISNDLTEAILTPRSDYAKLRETVKNPRATSQTLQASVSMLNDDSSQYN